MKNPTISLLLIAPLIAPLLISAATTAGSENPWFENYCRGNKNATKLHFYVHDVKAGPNATLFNVENSSITATSPTAFGRVNVFDNRVTVAPDIASEEVATEQGTTTSMDLSVQASAMNLNFFIKSGRFNGSTVTVIGRNQFADAQRELTVAGGTAAFRYARGYAITSTYSFDEVNNYGVFEYTVYITTVENGCA